MRLPMATMAQRCPPQRPRVVLVVNNRACRGLPASVAGIGTDEATGTHGPPDNLVSQQHPSFGILRFGLRVESRFQHRSGVLLCALQAGGVFALAVFGVMFSAQTTDTRFALPPARVELTQKAAKRAKPLVRYRHVHNRYNPLG